MGVLDRAGGSVTVGLYRCDGGEETPVRSY